MDVMRIVMLFAMTRIAHGYFSYSTTKYDDPLHLNSMVISDVIPQWAVDCFNDTMYEGPMCTPTHSIPGGIMYVQCPHTGCTREMVEAYHAYGAYKGISGIVFKGMYPENASCRRPSTFILDNIETDKNYYGRIGLREPDVGFAKIIVAYRWGMLTVSFLFLFVIMCVYTQSRRRNIQIIVSDEFTEQRTEPMEQNIRVITNTKYNPEIGEAICPICIEPFEDGETVSTLACGHTYKPRCIRDWLQKESRCPLCNATE